MDGITQNYYLISDHEVVVFSLAIAVDPADLGFNVGIGPRSMAATTSRLERQRPLPHGQRWGQKIRRRAQKTRTQAFSCIWIARRKVPWWILRRQEMVMKEYNEPSITPTFRLTNGGFFPVHRNLDLLNFDVAPPKSNEQLLAFQEGKLILRGENTRRNWHWP